MSTRLEALPCSYTLMAELTKGSDDTRDMNRCGGGDNGSCRTSLSLLADVDIVKAESLGDVPIYLT